MKKKKEKQAEWDKIKIKNPTDWSFPLCLPEDVAFSYPLGQERSSFAEVKSWHCLNNNSIYSLDNYPCFKISCIETPLKPTFKVDTGLVEWSLKVSVTTPFL